MNRDKVLFSSLVRLAASLPREKRRPLLEVLREASTSRNAAHEKWRVVLVNPKVRVRFDPYQRILVEELPQKGKRRLRRLIFNSRPALGVLPRGTSSGFLVKNLLREINLNSSMDYDKVKAALEKAVDKARKHVIKHSPDWDEKRFEEFGWGKDNNSMFFEDEVYYLEVEPADYSDILIKGKDWHGTFEWGSFTLYPNEQDEFMVHVEGMRTFYKSRSKGGARKAYKMVKADQDKVRQMTLNDLVKWLTKNRVAVEYVPTVWR